jgi:hypothetical protein
MTDLARSMQIAVDVTGNAESKIDEIIKKITTIPNKVQLDIGSNGGLGLDKGLSKQMDGVLGAWIKLTKWQVVKYLILEKLSRCKPR